MAKRGKYYRIKYGRDKGRDKGRMGEGGGGKNEEKKEGN